MAERAAIKSAPMPGPLERARRAAFSREAVFGVNDGLVSTVGLLSGLTGAGATRLGLLVAAAAAAWAAVVSMGIGAFLATRTQVALEEARIAAEIRELEEHPEEELEEMRAIYERYGFQPGEIAVLLKGLQRDRGLWLRLMLRDEWGILPERLEHPGWNALVMALAVAVGALVPLLPYLLLPRPRVAFPVAIAVSGLFAWGLGFVVGRLSSQPGWRWGLLFVGSSALAVALGASLGFALSLWGLH